MQNFNYSPSNKELVERCLQGDADAWNILVERYARLVRSVPSRYGLSQEDIDDITQDVFISLARYLDRLEDADALSKWLLVTARHRSWRVSQKRRKEQPALEGDLVDVYPTQATVQTLSVGPGLSELTDLWSQREVLSYGLQQMGARCQQLLYLLFLDPEQPSYEQICQQMDIAKGSVGPIRQRCLNRLRGILEQMENVSELLISD